MPPGRLTLFEADQFNIEIEPSVVVAAFERGNIRVAEANSRQDKTFHKRLASFGSVVLRPEDLVGKEETSAQAT